MILGKVLESSPNLVVIEISDHGVFESAKSSLQIGKYFKVESGNNRHVVCAVTNIKTSQSLSTDDVELRFLVSGQPIGSIVDDEVFRKGGANVPVPTESAHSVTDSDMSLLYERGETYSLPFGKLSQNSNVTLNIDGNNFFSKHIAVVGSTGSGKSCTVARIIQEVVGIQKSKNLNVGSQKNSHVIIFDIHSEYESAFKIHRDEDFTLNVMNVDNLSLPYWLMNSQELESLFIESNENNSHNQISQFKRAVILNKEKYNPTLKKVTYDSPVFFSIEEVANYISNLNEEVIGKLEGEFKPKIQEGEVTRLIEDFDKVEYFEKRFSFVSSSTSKAAKASNGPFHGEFNRFISRLDTKLNDKRLQFILKPYKENKNQYTSEDFPQIIQQFLGYASKANISIIDLSGIPFEVMSLTVSLVSRLIFDFAFHYTKVCHAKGSLNDIPFMIVCEEAHNYVPRDNNVSYRASRKSIERIAKEGRKYGLSLMVVSQRPSEVSETIFAQCNNFVALRLTNSNDQNYIKSLLPDNSNEIASILPSLACGECLIVGEATPLPSIVNLEMPDPAPKSDSTKFHDEWKKDWLDLLFDDVIQKWRS